MKNLFTMAFATLLISSIASAASLKVSASDSKNIIETLMLAGVSVNTASPTFTISMNDLNCKSRYVSHGGDPEEVMWGYAEYSCTNPEVAGAAAKLIYETLDSLETKYKNALMITDCAMGRCYVSLKNVSCTINSAEIKDSKRFSCVLTDTQ